MGGSELDPAVSTIGTPESTMVRRYSSYGGGVIVGQDREVDAERLAGELARALDLARQIGRRGPGEGRDDAQELGEPGAQ
ncbi:hypothetical protein ACFV29_43460 [Streptomyces sp. NPDC059690]|uniref:hypothetical protein n=1 Tax=Streptomyces sp. NPDC059690 TaxID=3346907 RepID=UPI00368C7575